MEYEQIQATNNSSLSWFEISPKYYNEMRKGNLKPDEASSLDFGTAFHCSVLEPTVFNDRYAILDGVIPTHAYHVSFCNKIVEGKVPLEAYSEIYSTKRMKDADVAKAANELYGQYETYIQFLKESKDKQFITKQDSQTIEMMKNSLVRHKQASALLLSDYELKDGRKEGAIRIESEFTIEFLWPRLNVKCKVRIDKLIIDFENKLVKIIDLKTTSKIVKNFKYACLKYGYLRQMGFYSVAVYEFLTQIGIDPTDGWNIEHRFITVETFKLYETRSFLLSADDIRRGYEQAHQIILQIQKHEELGEWDYPLEYYIGTGDEPLIFDTHEFSNTEI